MARETIAITLFNGQIVYSRRLFEPETKDMAGKPLDTPSYSCNVRFPKTKAHWWEEPALAPFMDAVKVIHAREMSGVNPAALELPIKDGDRPNRQGKTPDWAKGHWFIRASSGFAPKVEQLVNGQPSEIQSLSIGGRRLWGDGDFVAVAVSIAKRMNDNIGIRAYLNGVLFTGKGAELSTGGGSGVDWGAAVALAQQQGIQIRTGGCMPEAFPGAGANPGGFGTAPGAFQPAPFAPTPQPTFQPPGFGTAPAAATQWGATAKDDEIPF